MRRILTQSPWLVPTEAYDVAWTRLDDGFLHQRTQDPNSPQFFEDNASGPRAEEATNEWDWLSNGRSIVLTASTPTTHPVLLADNYRNLLIIQNTSVLLTGAAGTDTTPTLYVNVDGPVQLPVAAPANTPASGGYSLAFPAGFGIVLDTRILTNALYVAYSSFTNTDGKVVVGGVITYGRTPNSPPMNTSTGNVSMSPELAQYYAALQRNSR